MQLIDSSEREYTLLSKRTRVGFEPVTLWLRTSGTNHYTIAAQCYIYFDEINQAVSGLYFFLSWLQIGSISSELSDMMGITD